MGLALTELCDVESQDGNVDAALAHCERALAIHRANVAELDQARVLERRAQVHLRLGDPNGAADDSAAALAQFEAVGALALQADARAAFRATYRQAVALHIEALLAQVQASARTGDHDQVQRLLRAAFVASDRAHAQFLAESMAATAAAVPTELAAERQRIYELLAGNRQQRDRLLETASPDSDHLQKITRDLELLRARARLIDGRIAKLQAGGRNPPAAGDADWTRSLPHDAVVAEFFIDREHGWLLELRAGRVTVHELPSGRNLERDARELHLSWRRNAGTRGDRLAQGLRLARTLYGPLGDKPPSGGVWIVPDGALHLVPMAQLARQAWPGLPAGAAIVIPSFSALQGTPGPAAAPPRTLALIADPVYQADDPRIATSTRRPAVADVSRSALRRLASTAVEARELAALVANPEELLSLVGPQASREQVVGAPLDQYRIVHFAAHAFADSRDPALARIALSQFSADGQPINGALRQYDIAQLRLNADLVVLSGCDTAIGREIAGEGPIGLSHAFLRSGARTVVATIWQVPDTSTAVLMREFYREMLQHGRAAPEALARAQDTLRGMPRWSDPYFWAGFQLVSAERPPAGDNNDVKGREDS